MKNVLTLPEDKKIFSAEELRECGLSQYRIGRLLAGGGLSKLSKSYYQNEDYNGEESDFYYVEAFAPNGVICLMSAAVYYGLSTFIPDAIDVAIPRKSKVSTMPDWPQLEIHYYTDDRYLLGIRLVEEGRNDFKIYDMEKTIVDIVFYKEMVGIEETKEILRNYLQREDRDLDRLMRYAKLMKCEKAIRTYLEVLV